MEPENSPTSRTISSGPGETNTLALLAVAVWPPKGRDWFLGST